MLSLVIGLSIVGNIPTSLASTKIHQDGFTDILVLEEAEDRCIFETVSRDGRWCRHILAADSIGECSLNTTTTVSVGYDRLEKIAIVGSKRYLIAQSSGRFTLYDTFGQQVSIISSLFIQTKLIDSYLHILVPSRLRLIGE